MYQHELRVHKLYNKNFSQQACSNRLILFQQALRSKKVVTGMTLQCFHMQESLKYLKTFKMLLEKCIRGPI